MWIINVHISEILLSSEAIALSREYDVYVSRYIGKDSSNCGSKATPCRTLARGVEITVWNGRIFLDGTLSEWNPYTCERNSSNTSGIRDGNLTTVKVSLEIVAFRSPPRVNCGDLLQFVPSQSKNQKMKVTFTGVVFHNTSMTFIDSSVLFVNCSFSRSVYPVKIWLFLRQTASLVVKNSSLVDNTGCIRWQVTKPGGRISVTMMSVDFQRNQPLTQNEGSGITVQGTSTAFIQVGINISISSTTFLNNTGPLITNNITFSTTYEYYRRVKFVKTWSHSNSFSPNSGYFSKAKFAVVVFDDLLCSDNINTRCIQIDSNEVLLRILDSKISGHKLIGQLGAGIFIEADKSINLFISGTTLQQNAGEGGGAIAIRSLSADVRLTLYNCCLPNNTASKNGGALLVYTHKGLTIINVENITVEHCLALENGGAFYITADKEIVFNANNSLWAYNKASYMGAVIFVSSTFLHKRETNLNVLAKVRSCKFISNIGSVALWGSIVVKAAIGHVEVFQTEWIKNTNCFYIECNCVVNFTKVNVSSTFYTAVHISSGDNNNLSNSAMKIHFERCLFNSNKGDHLIVHSRSLYLYLVLNNIRINGKRMVARGTKSILNVHVTNETTLGSIIRLHDFLVKNAIGSASVIFKIMNNGAYNKVEISDSVFRDIKSIYSDKYHTTSSPVSFVIYYYNLTTTCNSPYLRFAYHNEITIRNTTFKNNIGRVSGGIFLLSGNVTIYNSRFENNYAITTGAHIHVADGSAMVRIENSILRQSTPETMHNGETFTHDTSIYSESDGSLVLQKTLVTVELEKDSYRVLTVSKAGLVSFDDFTKVQCAVGSSLRFDNFSHFTVLTGLSVRRTKCRFKTTVMSLSCHRCSPGLYSLKRGELLGLPEKRKLQYSGSFCTPCPHGANCSRNIFAEPNFWGYPDSTKHGALKFVHCPPHYCTPAGKPHKNLSVYNRCYGNRDGVMCGRCKEGYTETLLSTNCKRNKKCKDHWIWVLMFVYVVVMALFLIHQPPIVQILVKNILWFRKVSPYRMEYEPLDQQTNFNRGYTKILFYFYQIASYLAVEPVSDVVQNVPSVSFFSGLLNFHPRIATEGFGCLLRGLNVVTKELLLSSGVFATLLSIQAILVSHLAFNKLTGRPRRSIAPYVAATLETLLLGYATLANTSLKLLTCVPALGESRLYYDANIKCLQWWQYLFIVYIVAFLLPFIVVIYWGAMKLQRKLISVEHFIGSCFFPLGFIFFWLIQKFARPRNHHQLPDGTNKSGKKVLKVLHDPFLPPSPRQCGSLYWESVMIGRRFLLLSFQVFFPDPLLRLFFMNVTCLLNLSWHVTTKPFRDWKANITEAVSLAALVAIATINLVQAIFMSASISPNGPVKNHLIKLEQVEICLLGAAPVLFGLLCVFAILSQLVRIFVLFLRFLRYVWHRTFTAIVLRRLRIRGQY